MNHLNSVLLEGNLTAEPVRATAPNGTPVCTFAIASERSLKHEGGFEKHVSFFDIVTRGRLADACGTTLTKGRGVRVVGRLTQERWEQDGIRHSRVKVVAEHVEFKPTAAGDDTDSEGDHDPLGIMS